MTKRIDKRRGRKDYHTKEYQDAYQAAHYDRVGLRLPKGCLSHLDGISPSQYVKSLISRDTGKPFYWIPTSQGVRCPVCQTLYRYDSYTQPIQWHYCPSCGCRTTAEGSEDTKESI